MRAILSFGEPRRLGRHRSQFALADDRLKQHAFGRLAGDDGRPAVPPFADQGEAIEPQPRLRLAWRRDT